MGSAIIGLIILIASFLLNRMLKVDGDKKEITQPKGDIIESNAWDRINIPTVSHVPMQRKNLDSGDGEDYEYGNDTESGDYKSVMGQWSSKTTSPDGYVPMFGSNFGENQRKDSVTPPIFNPFMSAESNPMIDSSENNISQFSVSNYQFGNSFIGRDIETEIAKTGILKEAEELRISSPTVQKLSVDFNLQDAILYAAIFNPKYKEFDEFKEEYSI